MMRPFRRKVRKTRRWGSPSASVSVLAITIAVSATAVLRTFDSVIAPASVADADLHFQSVSFQSAAVWGDTVVLGALPLEPLPLDRRSAYVFTRSGNTWSQQAEVIPSDPPQEGAVGNSMAIIQDHDAFGASVAIYEDTIVVGAPRHDEVAPTDLLPHSSGAVFVFTRRDGEWTQEAKLTAPGASSFGTSVAIYGNTLVVGAPHFSLGAVYVFTRVAGVWSSPHRLAPSDPNEFFTFHGQAVAIFENTIAVGIPNPDSFGRSRGEVHVFVRSAGGWSEQQRLTASDTRLGDGFGDSVALWRDRLVVGASFGRGPEDPGGAAYVFTRSNGAWTEQQKLVSPETDPQQADGFGNPVATSWNTIVVGDWRESSPVYSFTLGSDGWTQPEALTTSATLHSGTILSGATALTMWGGTVIARAAAPRGDDLLIPAVAKGAYVFEIPAVSVSVVSPNPGPVVVDTTHVGRAPEGFAFFGSRVSITAPSASVTNPLVLRFSILPIVFPPGTSVEDVVVFRDGVAVAACTGSPQAVPDPCVSERAVVDGEFVITVLSSQASDWEFATVGPTVGLVDPTQGLWYLRTSTGSETSFFYGNPGDLPFMGDWNCDGIDTPGLYRQSDGFVYLRNSNTQGVADITFFFGNPGDIPMVGDFNGDGCDTVSIYRPSEQRFYIINELGQDGGGLGAAEFSYIFGNPGDKPFVGDFNGDGVHTVGLHRESTGLVYFRNTHTQGVADSEFFFGNPGDRFIAGDWNKDGVDTPGLFRPSNTTFYFRFTNTQGNANLQFVWGDSGWIPVTGNFGPG